MENTQTQLTKRIMRRVYFIYALKKIFSPALVKSYILIALLWQATTYISIVNVLENTFLSVREGSVWDFSREAFLSTEVVTLLIGMAAIVVFVWLCRDIFKETSNHVVA